MADTTFVLYDAFGNPVTLTGAGATPPVQANGNGHPTVADTTRDLQIAAEETQPPDITGGATRLPFGPVLPADPDGTPAPPPFPVIDEGDGPRRAFRLAERIGLMPMLRFAHAAKVGIDSTDMEGMAALYTFIQDTVEADDWDAFVEYAIQVKAEDDDLMDFVQRAMEVITARPQKRRGNSSGTSANTSPKSRGYSSGQATPIPPGAITPAEIAGLMPVADLTR